MESEISATTDDYSSEVRLNDLGVSDIKKLN